MGHTAASAPLTGEPSGLSRLTCPPALCPAPPSTQDTAIGTPLCVGHCLSELPAAHTSALSPGHSTRVFTAALWARPLLRQSLLIQVHGLCPLTSPGETQPRARAGVSRQVLSLCVRVGPRQLSALCAQHEAAGSERDGVGSPSALTQMS